MEYDWNKGNLKLATTFDARTLDRLFDNEKVFWLDDVTGKYEAYQLDDDGFPQINHDGTDVITYSGCTGGPILVVFEDGKVPQADT